MANSFRQRILQSIQDETLQAALDANTERRLKGRAAAFESIPDWRERRQRAKRIRADVIENLEAYLEQFIARNRENGVIVHRTKDGKEAIKIFLEIAKGMDSSKTSDGQAKKVRVAKSKSMASEEISLNHALEAEGIEVVETDLGEYIVQLRRERPSHIITPAAHLKKEQVARLFHEKLGIEYTTDIPTLTATARRVLREIFLTADIGFSGVNFGVAETGSVCIVTNEGNGRMVATVPSVHVALMGMERLVPALQDLALMLSLLPRSATGQKLTVYTQLLNQPLQGQTRHLIILDNGRARLKKSPLKEALYCIRCGACLNACPVFRELGGHAYVGEDKSIAPYPGPIGSVLSPGLFGENYFQLAQASSLCGACKEACPVDIDLPTLLTRVRAGQSPANESRPPTVREGAALSAAARLGLRIYARVATRPRIFAAAQKFASAATFLLAPRSGWMRLPAFTGWGYSKDFPRFAGKTFRDRAGKMQGLKIAKAESVQFEKAENRQVARTGEAQTDSARTLSFKKELEALGGKVYESKNVTQDVIAFLKSRGVSKIYVEPGALDESALREASVECAREPDDKIVAGVTRAICGLADTGSILVADGAGNPLRGSLLPEIHLATLRAQDIFASLPDAIEKTKNARAAVFITGPSRTADIEMTLTIGVHGPKEIHVFIDDLESR